jgi:2-isopropylmalate synthase
MLTLPGGFIKQERTQGVVTFARQVVSIARAAHRACRQTGKKTQGDSYADPTC